MYVRECISYLFSDGALDKKCVLHKIVLYSVVHCTKKKEKSMIIIIVKALHPHFKPFSPYIQIFYNGKNLTRTHPFTTVFTYKNGIYTKNIHRALLHLQKNKRKFSNLLFNPYTHYMSSALSCLLHIATAKKYSNFFVYVKNSNNSISFWYISSITSRIATLNFLTYYKYACVHTF